MKFSISDIIKNSGDLLDKLFTSKEEKLKAAIELQQLDNELILGQQEVNKIEANHKSIVVAGWRPFIGWVCGSALAYQFIIYPLLTWALKVAIALEWIQSIAPPPVFEIGPLMALITGMLGIGGMRSYDKVKKVSTDRF